MCYKRVHKVKKKDKISIRISVVINIDKYNNFHIV